jgi:hypothetical protein
MTYRVLLLIPEGLSFDLLSQEQQSAIQGVFGQYVLPMPGTIPHDGLVLCDAVVDESFNPADMGDLGLDWPLVGIFDEAGSVVMPLDEAAFMARLPAPDTGDKVLHEPHRWAGWPKCFGE